MTWTRPKNPNKPSEQELFELASTANTIRMPSDRHSRIIANITKYGRTGDEWYKNRAIHLMEQHIRAYNQLELMCPLGVPP